MPIELQRSPRAHAGSSDNSRAVPGTPAEQDLAHAAAPAVPGRGALKRACTVLARRSALILLCLATCRAANGAGPSAASIPLPARYAQQVARIGHEGSMDRAGRVASEAQMPVGVGACAALKRQHAARHPAPAPGKSDAESHSDSAERHAYASATNANGVAYFSGSADPAQAIDMRDIAGLYNLCLAFAGKQRAWIAGVKANIYSANGTLVFQAYADGPFLLLRLTPGRYRLVAEYDGSVVDTVLRVPRHGAAARMLWWPDLASLVV
ncbi:hypothetical protein [Cupriavidus pinatubonensis]|nr:hypothetical protein [Cupriavidus pinatubonensis]